MGTLNDGEHDIISDPRKANGSHKKTLLHTHQDDYDEKMDNNKFWQGYRELTSGENGASHSCFGKQIALQKLSIELFYFLATLKTQAHTHKCSHHSSE